MPDVLQEFNGSMIALCSKQIELTAKITFNNLTNLVLSGYPNRTNITCVKNLKTGFEIRASRNIQILNVVLRNCGAVHSLAETTRKNSLFASSIHVSDTTQIKIQNVHIISGIGKGLTMFNSYGHVEDCLFQENNEYQGYNWVYGGGMYVELTSAFNFDHQYGYKNLTVLNSKFLYNEIPLPKQGSRQSTFVRCNSKTEFQGFTRGGGIAIYLRGQVERASIKLENLDIRGNKAIWGGGMNLHFCKQAHQNRVYIQNVTFTNNSCEHYGGGGVDVGFTYENGITTARENSLYFLDCIFEFNKSLIWWWRCSVFETQ